MGADVDERFVWFGVEFVQFKWELEEFLELVFLKRKIDMMQKPHSPLKHPKTHIFFQPTTNPLTSHEKHSKSNCLPQMNISSYKTN